MIATLLVSITFCAGAAKAQFPQNTVLNVTGGVSPGGVNWADSYSVGENCYCASSFDHNIGPYYVETPLGWMTVRNICQLLGPGPGMTISDNQVYNDVQCGNGPPNDAGDEHVCPGRTDIGEDGCGHIGPKWNFEPFISGPAPTQNTTSAHPDIVAVLNVTGNVTPGGLSWADSYSVGQNCYCASTFDHDIDTFYVDTPLSWMTVRQVCDLLGPGPGISGNPVYNDIQCGNGPPNNAGDEHVCPGRTDIGVDGCGHIGPKWNFESFITSISTNTARPSQFPSTSDFPSLPLSSSDRPSLLPSVQTSGSPSLLPLLQPSYYPSLLPLKQSSESSSEAPEVSESPSLPSASTSGGHGQLPHTSRSLFLLSFAVFLFP